MLYRITLVTLLFTVLWHSPAEGQARLRFGPELGVSVAQLPGRNVLYSGGNPFPYREFERKELVVGPLIGGRAQLEVGSRWLLAGAARYQMLGKEYSYILELTPEQNITTTSQFRRRHRSHQIGVPLSVGYRLFRIGGAPVTFSAGAQFNWLIDLTYQEENLSKRQGKVVLSEKRDPVDMMEQPTPFRVPVRPFQIQIHTSLSVPLGDKFRLFVQYNAGRRLRAYDDLSTLQFDPWIDVVPFGYGASFRHNECSIVAAYLL